MDTEHPLEIEKKYLINKLPDNLDTFPHHQIEQGYLCHEPVLRIRRWDNDYILTYKAQGMMIREEHEHPLSREAYEHLLAKTDGTIITKTRYCIPASSGHTIELDIFGGRLDGFIMAEVEFKSKEDALSYSTPEWFGEEVTLDSDFHNCTMSRMSDNDCNQFMKKYRKTF